jgi:endonuclease/exonuclease/phosphatase family metal-dependent hydrolase
MVSARMRLLTYNILKGRQGRETKIVEVIQAVAPDVVVVQEVLEVDSFHRIAAALKIIPHLADNRGGLSLRVGLLSRLPILDFRTLHL